MKPRHSHRALTLLLTILAIFTTVSIAVAKENDFPGRPGGHGGPGWPGNNQQQESLALRKVIGAFEVASLNSYTSGIPQVTRDLVESAIVILERDNGNQPGNGINLGTYTTPNYFDNLNADADFNIPWGNTLINFSFVTQGSFFADYILLFGRNGEQLYRQPLGRFVSGTTLNFRVPSFVNPTRIATIRLHHIARRGTQISAYADNGQFGGGDNSQAISVLNDVRMALSNYNPDMYFVRSRLQYVEQLIRY